MIEVYRGSANTWECDEMGHMNVRFYVNRMMEGLAGLAHEAGMPRAFRPSASSTLAPRDQHIRFLREARPGAPFVMNACVLDVQEASVLVFQQIDHASGEPCAAFRTWVDHIDAETGRPFPWRARTRAALEKLMGRAPANTAPRSLESDAALTPAPTLAHADAIGAPLIGRGVVPSAHCDPHGRMLPEFFIGRISDSITNLLAPWRAEVARRAAAAGGEPIRAGGAVLEYRVAYRKWPQAGDRFVIRTGLGMRSPKTYSLVHWMMDPESGQAWCTSEALTVTLDLDTRKVVPAPPEQVAALADLAPIGLKV